MESIKVTDISVGDTVITMSGSKFKVGSIIPEGQQFKFYNNCGKHMATAGRLVKYHIVY